MQSPIETIAHIRDSVCAILRITKHVKKRGKKKPPITEFRLAFTGTAWCVSTDKYLVTAHHILNGGKARDPNDRFYAFTVPSNDANAYHFPIIGFPLEDSQNDMAILELGGLTARGQGIPAMPVTFDRPSDGESVITYGFPAPIIVKANITPEGEYAGGQFFLKGHANEGIVAAQYDLDNAWHYEFNVGWHNGESGGPVTRTEPVAAFAIMQHYRNIQTPHGVMAGPHRGRALEAIQSQLAAHGAKVL